MKKYFYRTKRDKLGNYLFFLIFIELDFSKSSIFQSGVIKRQKRDIYSAPQLFKIPNKKYEVRSKGGNRKAEGGMKSNYELRITRPKIPDNNQ